MTARDLEKVILSDVKVLRQHRSMGYVIEFEGDLQFAPQDVLDKKVYLVQALKKNHIRIIIEGGME